MSRVPRGSLFNISALTLDLSFLAVFQSEIAFNPLSTKLPARRFLKNRAGDLIFFIQMNLTGPVIQLRTDFSKKIQEIIILW